MYRPHAPAWRPRHAPAPAPPPAPRPTPRAEDRQPQEGIEASRRRQAPSILATPYPVASSSTSADGQALAKASKKVEKKRRRRERELVAAQQGAAAAVMVAAVGAEEKEKQQQAKSRGLWHDVRGIAPVARPSRPYVRLGPGLAPPTAPRAMRPPPPPPAPQTTARASNDEDEEASLSALPPASVVARANDVEDEEEYLDSLPSPAVLPLAVPSPAPAAPSSRPGPARPPQPGAPAPAAPVPSASNPARTSQPTRPAPSPLTSAVSPVPLNEAEPASRPRPEQAVPGPPDSARGTKRSNALAFPADPPTRPAALPPTAALPGSQHLVERDSRPSVRRRSQAPVAVDSGAAVPEPVELLARPSIDGARPSSSSSSEEERKARASSPPVRTLVVKVERTQIDVAVSTPAVTAPAPSPPPSWTTSDTAPVEQPDVKPVIHRRSPSPPTPPPPASPNQGVASWTRADVPAECNLSGPLLKAERDRARRRFRLRREWELQNECKAITNARWISGGLSLDWRVDRAQGTFTALYPAELVRAGGAEAKRAFLEREVASAECKGWSILCAGEKTAAEGGPVGITISWEASGRASPSAKLPPPSRGSAETTRESTEASSVGADAPRASSSSPHKTTAQSPVPAPLAPAIRVKPEPMDVDVPSIPPPPAPPAPAVAAPPSPPRPSPSAAPPSLAPAAVKPRPEPTGSLVSVLQDELSKSIALLVDLRAVDVDPRDGRAIDRARAHNAWLFEELAQAQTRIDERLGEMADRILAEQAAQPH